MIMNGISYIANRLINLGFELWTVHEIERCLSMMFPYLVN